MNFGELLFDQWAPPTLPWSAWAKPVFFATMPELQAAGEPMPALDLVGLPAAKGDTALVIDLPGALAIRASLAAARCGYRPVPLINTAWNSSGAKTLDLLPLVAAIIDETDALTQLKLPYDAPPAFVLDSRRRVGDTPASPGMFDNRWVSLPTDFPSATTLLGAGIRRVILVCRTARDGPLEDLAHTMLRWKQAGIEMVGLDLEGALIHPMPVRKPNAFRSILHTLLAFAGLKRSPLGGFGGRLPIPTESGGYG